MPQLATAAAPHIPPLNSVPQMMRQVLYALLPGIAMLVYSFGWGVVINILLACGVALVCEAAILLLRRRPLGVFLGDYSALVTATLLAIALPPLAPWWLTVLGVAFAIVFGKHLYGGLGFNPFNPAMIGYAMLLVSFPREMTQWLPALENAPGLFESARAIFAGALPTGLSVDAMSGATPLDALRDQEQAMSIAPHWAGVNLAFLAGGLWLLYRRVIGWQIPAGVLGGLAAMAALFWLLDPAAHAGVGFHLLAGGTMLAAFFIATDPVSAATTPRGRLLFGLGIGVLIYVIRAWGGYPDGIAFAVLLMNIAAPLIDHYTRPRIYGHSR
ncbi:electron transport complex subunit RsxD [Alkalilimnicola ehrlichii]|uniref:Ion-translocating oxidoreductase complex subunit D n=1 Tax=Alkalilimnicola ehrlichii TaxID=351052 RepID=A0A3E0WFG7_9GAMM|nr:RnfABCDGE type electron transport complex subunit D [Alkalilimnicola ehrlichii]RFA24596.1 electron transport complex subunit RsxD [Alkalilimnicola ehrlichii]RFA31670.1 electron transport complex subunit RsxD [Alkalilimnicola ehrlichii]